MILSADESLLRALESKQYGRPLALGAVIRESMQQRDLIPLQDFATSKESIYHRSWASIPWAVAAWGFRQLGLTGAFTFGSDDRLPGGQFVVIANLEDASRSLMEQTSALTSHFERTFSKVQFQTEFRDSIMKGQRLSETDMEVLLKFMSRDQGLLLYDGKTIKVKATGIEEPTVTAEDETIASLKELTGYLEHQTAMLNKKIEELTITAKDAVTKKNRVSALAALKSKKLAESSLQKRFATLSQLEEVSAKIEQASDNVQLVKVMGASASVLKDLNAQVGGAEGVEDAVDRLREQMGQADEVSSILAEQAPVVDEGEIDDELEAMEQEEKRKEDEERRKRELLERARKEAQEQREAEKTARKLAELDALKSATSEPQATEESADSQTSTGRIPEPLLESR